MANKRSSVSQLVQQATDNWDTVQMLEIEIEIEIDDCVDPKEIYLFG